MGEIVALGTDEDLKDVLGVGDVIIYAKYSGNEISLDGEDYIILDKSDILAKLVK